MGTENSAGERPLRPGDVVEVKSPAEILSTLDDSGALGSMPFMPEMLRHVGRRYTVSPLVDKICDRRLAFLQALQTWPRFGKGWRARVEGVRKTARPWARTIACD